MKIKVEDALIPKSAERHVGVSPDNLEEVEREVLVSCLDDCSCSPTLDKKQTVERWMNNETNLLGG